jgi:transposase InsO family protein
MLAPSDEKLEELLFESFLIHLPNNPFPLNFQDIAQAQMQDQLLQQLKHANPNVYQMKEFANSHLLCFRHTLPNVAELIAAGRDPYEWKICIPSASRTPIIRWYHFILNHPGAQRLYKTIATNFHFPGLCKAVDDFTKTCDSCQRNKLPGRGHGKLPMKEAKVIPFDEVAVDLIGPWQIDMNGQTIEFQALTSIDTATGMAELTRINNRTSSHVSLKFENEYLSRYPRPLRCIHDNGPEFLGPEFQLCLHVNGIKDVPTTVKNPQANAICERIHQVVGNNIRTLIHATPPENVQEANDIVDTCLASAAYASRATIHHTLQTTPGSLVFHRDMVLPIQTFSDWNLLQQRKQRLIDDNARRENLRRFRHDYEIGDEVLIFQDIKPKGKLLPRAVGPYEIVQVHANGTVTIQRGPFQERLNIRRCKPYHREGGE